ncbi:MAG TPA: hypothetical protein VFQ91_11135 [Bryobacteraceae bacterium]|nr:hypothetical protein [Bryobacteraceae bacterium]
MRIVLLLFIPALLFGQRAANFEGRPATALENDKIELLTLNKGGAFASLLLKSDAGKMNPMWNPIALARKSGGGGRFGDSIGHFLCVDGFGGTSKEEQAAGLQGHGEAHRQPWELISKGREGKKQHLTWTARLPLVHETLTRTVEVVDGEQVIYVDTTLESELAFDRPVNWAEHATIGYPFLAPGKTVVDASVGQCQTRPHQNMPPNRRLVSDKPFTYPSAPLKAGGMADLRQIPDPPDSMDHSGCVFDPSRRLAFVTAINLETRLLLGYLVRREEYPWIQEWMNYPSNLALARGLEFGTQPYDVPRRETIEMGSMFNTPTYRWLPAKSKIGSRFLMFYVQVPNGFQKVDDVQQVGGELVLTDKKSGQTVRLAASLPL